MLAQIEIPRDQERKFNVCMAVDGPPGVWNPAKKGLVVPSTFSSEVSVNSHFCILSLPP